MPSTSCKANSRSTVHRPAYLDYVGVKSFDAEGRVVGERRFLGLYTASAYVQSVADIPVIRRTVQKVLDDSGLRSDGHSYRDLEQFLETYPRDELFEIEPTELAETAFAVQHMQERRQTRLFMRRDRYGRYVSCLVYLPRDRYTTRVRLAMADVLSAAFGTDIVDYTARVSESVLARLHFVVRAYPRTTLPEVAHDLVAHRTAAVAPAARADEVFDAVVQAAEAHEARGLAELLAEEFAQAREEEEFAAFRDWITAAVRDPAMLQAKSDAKPIGPPRKSVR